MKKVAVIMGSDSDLKTMQGAIDMLRKLEIPFTVRVISAHRTPEAASDFAAGAKEAGYGALICGAGKAAHLAGAFAANTCLPVIGVPIRSSFDGLDALLATVQMPTGIPVATVAVNGAENAAVLAAEMLALSDDGLKEQLRAMKDSMREGVEKKDAALQEKLKEL